MNDISDFLVNNDSFFIFDHLTAEIHIWKILRNNDNQIESWQLIYANPPTLKTWGYKKLDEIKGKDTDEIFGTGAKEHYLPIVRKITEDNEPYTFQDYFPNLNKYFRFTSVPLGEYFITTGDDITEFIEDKKSMQEANSDLEHLIKQRTSRLKSSEEEIRILKGIIPICSYCHNIRNDEGAWDQLEAYISKHSDAQFSHGICPACIIKVRAESGLDDNQDK